MPTNRTPDADRLADASPKLLQLHVGTYTDGESRGIHLTDFDPCQLTFTPPRLAAPAVNPTFSAWHPSLPLLYVVSETDTFGASGTGSLQVYRANDDGELALIEEVSTGGAGACHLTIAGTGRHAWVANYGAGSVAAFDMSADGRVGAATQVIIHEGRGVHPTRQTRPHAHAVEVALGGGFLLAADLGTDEVLTYRLEPRNRALAPHPSSISTRPGAGPRHIAFARDGRTALVLNELDSTLVSYAWDGNVGTLEERDRRSTLPDGWSGENTTAEVAVHPSGRWVYASNRGHDSIAVFRLEDGALTLVGVQATGGRTPRHFALDPTGTFLLAANQESDSIVVFRVDESTGQLSETGARVRVPCPVHVGIRPA